MRKAEMLQMWDSIPEGGDIIPEIIGDSAFIIRIIWSVSLKL